MAEKYSSRFETISHRNQVAELLHNFSMALTIRSMRHDLSKTEEPELSVFDKYTPMLREVTYGSPEYLACLREMKPALDHHYANNRHHPEYHKKGVLDMTLVDLIEMLCDWKAASLRHSDGDILRSLEINERRFNIPPALMQILKNTVEEGTLIRSNIAKEFHP